MSNKTILFLRNKSNLYLFASSLFLCGLVFSKFLTSIAVFLFVFIWLFDKELPNKVIILIKSKTALALLLIIIIHFAGMLYTQDIEYALKDIRIKLPLLVFPIIFSTEKSIQTKNFFDYIIELFLLFIVLSSFFSLWIYIENIGTTSLRMISPFISHIRMGLLTSLGSFIFFFIYYKQVNKKTIKSFLLLFGGLYLTFFTIFILSSFNALIVYILLAIFSIFVIIYKSSNKTTKYKLYILITICLFLSSYYIIDTHNAFFPKIQKEKFKNLDTLSASGNPYNNQEKILFCENGNPVYIYINNKELREEWHKKSNININSYTKKNTPIYDILIRYLSSKNLRKDSVGVSLLTEKDISNIKKGIPNYLLSGKPPITYKLYEVFGAYYNYIHTNNPNGNVVFLRFEYWKTAIKIIKTNLFFGVGTGDIKNAFENQYNDDKSILEPHWRLRSHNQYLSIAVAFGLVGLLIFLFALIYPPIKLNKFKSYYFLIVFITLLTSMITEDTLETQVGASIFSFFYVFFLYSENNE